MTSALDAAWSAAWSDFLANRVALAERRTAPFLHTMPERLAAAAAENSVSAEQSAQSVASNMAEELVTLADMAHIAGAVRGDDAVLRLALTAYQEHLRREPSNLAAMRMLAETWLRLRQYSAAFAAFDRLYEASLAAAVSVEGRETAEVAPFQLIHDAECLEDAVALGADPAALTSAAGWRSVATWLQAQDADATRRVALRDLSEAQRILLASHGQPLPLLPIAPLAPASTRRALRADIDWREAMRTYAVRRVVVIDNILEPDALAELQAYVRHGAHFRTLRRGYLGAFPSDGTTHPLIQLLAEELSAAAPSIFGAHALALWWIFKYDETNPAGIGIHADPAAVNLNIWLTDDGSCLEGGGLVVYSHVPPLERETLSVNHVFESEAAEQALRDKLTAEGSVLTIPYRCNRAAAFVSDQFHESLPFTFRKGYHHRRANLTLLFGDRWSADDHRSAVESTAAVPREQLASQRGESGILPTVKLEPPPPPGAPALPSAGGQEGGGWDVFDF